MDLLNSILNSMEAPPAVSEQQKIFKKKQKEMVESIKKQQQEELEKFRKYVEDRIGRFAKDDRPHIEFQPLDYLHRSIIYKIAKFGGFIAMSFGREDVGCYSVVYKKENFPSNDEINARRNGDGWNEVVAKEYAERRRQSAVQEIEQNRQIHVNDVSAIQNEKVNIEPVTNYKDKYAHLFGQSAALEAARKTETNQSYGFVPSKNKKDIRTIEETLADIQAKKKRRLQLQQEQEGCERSSHDDNTGCTNLDYPNNYTVDKKTPKQN